MTNQEAFEAARAGDWIAESFTRSGDVFTISGKSTGYSSFADCLNDGESVFYSAFDEADNREAGLAVWDASAKTLTPVEIHASLIGGAFIKGDPDPVQFSSGGTITGTLNATAFNTIWGHVFEKGNPHETQADEIDQSNDILGDTVQEALNKIATYVAQLDPDGDTDIDWGDLDGLKDLLDGKAEQTDLEQEILDRIAGDAALQAQIDAIDPDGDSDIDWSDIENKPTEFPPSSHGHEIDDVNGLQDALDAAGGTPAWDDVTGKPTEFPPEDHTHEQSEVDGLELRLDAIEDSITSGGGFVDAPDDGKLYGRQSEAWAEVVIPDAADPEWSGVQNKPTEFPPEDHTHVVADITDFDPADYQPVGDYATTKYVDDSIAAIDIPEGGTGSSVHIGESPPTGDLEEGQQWMEVPLDGDATMWIYDGGKWLQQPGGKDGAAGADGNIADGAQDGVVATWDSTANSGAGQWTPDSSLTIDATGSATFSGTLQSGTVTTIGLYSGVMHLRSPRLYDTSADGVGIYFNSVADGAGEILPTDNEGNLVNVGPSIGSSTRKFKNAYFSGSIETFSVGRDGHNGISFSGQAIRPREGGPGSDATDGVSDLGTANYRFKDAHFSGAVTTGQVKNTGKCGLGFGAGFISPLGADGNDSNGEINLGAESYRLKDAHFSGTVSDGSGPLMSKRGLISTLSTLRNATKDETTLEGLRDSIGNAIGGLIEEFENQIATMPAGDES